MHRTIVQYSGKSAESAARNIGACRFVLKDENPLVADLLTYPLEIVIESDIELPPKYWQESGDGSVEVEAAWLLIEILLELLGGL